MSRCGRVLVVLLATASAAMVFPAPAAARPPAEWLVGRRTKVAMVVLDGHAGPKAFRSVLDTLDALDAGASFFVSGRWIRNHKAVARSIVRAGHVLGNRGNGRRLFTEMGERELRSSIRRATHALRAVGARPRPFLRAPKGRRGLKVLRVAGSTGYRSVRWTHHPGGGRHRKVRRAVLDRLRRGSIISLDMWRKSHRRALSGIVSGIVARGYDPATLDKLRGAHAVRWDLSLGMGSTGPEVAHLQRRLTNLRYPVKGLDGAFGERTQQGVHAFQKVHGIERDGVVSPKEMAMIELARRPTVRRRKAPRYIEVDISRQVLFEVRRRRVVNVFPISSGNEKYYKQDGVKYKAHTPRGRFRIERKIRGWRKSRLGRLWYPSYFVGGYAIHGSPRVPVYPASHGCVRIPMWHAKAFYKRNPIGTRVIVHK